VKIALGYDHAGHLLRESVCAVLTEAGHEISDFGTTEAESCDYPDIVAPVAQALQRGEADLGVLMCGTGIGVSIAANKYAGVYAACCGDTYSARMARSHNQANVITLGARVLGPDLAAEILREFLRTAPSTAPRHLRRQEKVRQIEATQTENNQRR
jgi:ribose 5-phosphate isomerase B